MNKVRIACGAGFSGDRVEPALDIIKSGEASYIIFECLAERTIAMAQKEKRDYTDNGYDPLLEYRMERVIPLLEAHPIKIITNMGAANPSSAADKVYEIAKKNGLSNLKIAVVEGDNILSELDKYYKSPFIETGDSLDSVSNSIISANAYIGGEPISEALAEDADIVLCGRVADPALAVGALMFEFKKKYNDFDFLGKCTLAGHLLECAGQVTGGYYADPGIKDVHELWNLGFPILTFHEDGSMVIEKLPNTGGLVNSSTVKEQLIYEVQDPARYITPDVIADFSKVTIDEIGKHEVRISGATGKAPTSTLKVGVGYVDGWIGEGEISYGGYNAKARAELAGEVIRKRLEIINLSYRELRIDMLGVNSLFGDTHQTTGEPIEVRLRVCARVDTKDQAEKIGREVEALYTNGPAGGGGARQYAHEVVAMASFLAPRCAVTPQIMWKGGCGS